MKFENLLPVFAPTPAGLVIAIRLYQEILVAVGFENGYWQIIAGIGALVGCIGMIGTEMYAYKQAGLAIADGKVGAALAAFAMAVICSGFVIWAIGTSSNTRPLVSAVIVAIAAYVVLAIKGFVQRKVEIVEGVKTDEQAQRDYDFKMEKQKTSQAQAAARAAKASALSTGRVSTVQIKKVDKLDSRKAQKVKAAWASNPEASDREIARLCEVSPMTAGKYRLEAVK